MKPKQIPYIRIFLSSPGDVSDERQIAMQVIEQLPYRRAYRERVAFHVIAWDKPGAEALMRANITPQEAINRSMPTPAECDIVLVILWSRMGTPFVDIDKKEYLSGTHWELLNALEAERPETLIYRRVEEPPAIGLKDPLYQEKRDQYNKVEAFFKSTLFYDTDGKIKRGINTYKTSDDFRQSFERALEEIVSDLLGKLEAGIISQEELEKDNNITTIHAIEWDAKKSPFPGLRAFTEDDASIFFGRGRETDELIQLVKNNRFVAVIGASGSGKSSLVGAGLIPRLRNNAITSEETRSEAWKIVYMKPDITPFESLYRAIIKVFPKFKPNALESHRIKQNFLSSMREAPETILEIWEECLENEPDWTEIFLFIDQFEEVFTVIASHDDLMPFIHMLMAINESERARVVITMRHDFYPKAIEVLELAKLLNVSLNLSAPKRDALRQMIERPAERAQLILEDGLVQSILDDTGDEPGNLALMAYALDELYKLDSDRHLSHSEYNQLGRVQGAIGVRAENTFKSLQLDESIIQQVFHALIEVDERGTVTRRRHTLQTESTTEDIQRFIKAFTDARLLTTSYDAQLQTAVVEVAHEAILHRWKRLADWIDATQDDHRIISRMKREAYIWRDRGELDHLRPNAEVLKEFSLACGRLDITIDDELLKRFTEPEQKRLYHELDNLLEISESHERRYQIGERLAIIGDIRDGVGIRNGLPQLVWLAVDGSKGLYSFDFGEFDVRPFFISKYQITYVQYQAFEEADDGFKDARWWIDIPKEYKKKRLNPQHKKNNLPCDNVSWYQSVAFTRWMNHKLKGLILTHDSHIFKVSENAEIRLPTEWEWQWVAQNGDEQRAYPWGQWTEGYANTSESGLARAVAVGLYPKGKAKCGAMDMTGNLWEWCLNDSNTFDTTNNINSTSIAIRGGSFNHTQNVACASCRNSNAPYNHDNLLGFRPVVSFK